VARLAIAVILLLPLYGQQPPSHVQSAATSLQRGDPDGAVREAKAALAADPRDPAAHMLLGQAYLAKRSVAMVAEAKAELQQALDLDPNLLWARFYLARIYIDLGLYDKAKDQLERGLKTRPDVPHFLSLLGDVERQLGHPQASIDLNRKALERDATLTPAHYYMALAYLDLKNQDEAARELDTAIASPYVAPEMYVALASIDVDRGRLNEAEALCKKAAALDETRAETYVALARVYNAKGAAEQAIAAVKLALPEGRTFPATAYYQKIQADAYFELGRAYQAKKMKAAAVEALTHALELDPARAETRRYLEALGQ
jgi:tetratricopeptide (TPR) repeat protein